jgi:hypothetical protein
MVYLTCKVQSANAVLKSKPERNRRLILLFAALLVLGLSVFYLASRQHEPTAAVPHGPQTDKTSTSSNSVANPGEGARPSTSGSGNPPPSSTTAANPGHPVTARLAKPSGQTINKDTVSLSSSSLKYGPVMNSSCQTVIGGLCGLKLAGPNGEGKQVDPSITNDQGGNSFDWNAKTLGLTQGIWKVQLYATYKGDVGLGNQYNLVVQP